MKRLHVHIAVKNLSESIEFYSTLFNSTPSIAHEDYAKWNLAEPAVNFAISNRGHSSGINHLGIEFDSDDELSEIKKRFENTKVTSMTQEEASCCYANSNKHWTHDPQGIAWESFHTLHSIPTFGKDKKSGLDTESSDCCIPLKNNKEEDNTACCISNVDNSDSCCSL